MTKTLEEQISPDVHLSEEAKKRRQAAMPHEHVDRMHHEYFREGYDAWEWWERLDDGEWWMIKTFTRESFVEEVLEPCLDHTAGCDCSLYFHSRDGSELPEWLQVADIPTVDYDGILQKVLPASTVNELGCYGKGNESCRQFRTASRKRKEELLKEWGKS